MSWWRGAGMLAAAVVTAGYALAVHYSNSHPGSGAAGATLSLLPLLLPGWLLRRSWRPVWWVAAALGAALVIVAAWPLLTRNYPGLYLLQQLGAYLALGIGFGMTLRRGQIPLCTRIAAQVQRPLPEAVARYTRAVTLVWTMLFLMLALTLMATFLLLPLRLWSLYANFVAPLIIGMMFAAEALARRRALPPPQRTGLLAWLRLYLQGSA